MAAGKYDFVIEQGTLFYLYIEWLDEQGNYVNLTDATARLKARIEKADTDAVVDWSTANGGQITITAAMGRIEISVLATATDDLDFNSAFYDLEIDFGAGIVVRLLEGIVTLSKEVTR